MYTTYNDAGVCYYVMRFIYIHLVIDGTAKFDSPYSVHLTIYYNDWRDTNTITTVEILCHI